MSAAVPSKVRVSAPTIITCAVIATLAAFPVAAIDNLSSPPGAPDQPGPSEHNPNMARLQQAVTIITSGNSMHLVWEGVANGMGHTATVVPTTTLDDTGFFATTDILIVSDGLESLSPTHTTNIQGFIEQGGAVYMQSEYQCPLSTNVTFAIIVSALGGTHTWIDTVDGDLQPMNVLGLYSTTPNNVSSIGYYWYGCRGTGDGTITPFLEFGGDYFGFAFKSTNPAHGVMITTTDQDWVNQSVSLELMENILNSLETGTVPVELTGFSID